MRESVYTPRQYELPLTSAPASGALRQRLNRIRVTLTRDDLTRGERLDLQHEADRLAAVLRHDQGGVHD